MTALFPSPEWMTSLKNKLNGDAQYAQIARNWEGELCIQMEPSGPLTETMLLYFDLWHGSCRAAEIIPTIGGLNPAFLLTSSYGNIAKILKGELDTIQALMTRKLQVKGSMAYMMRNVPTVLDFVRCCREITSDILA